MPAFAVDQIAMSSAFALPDLSHNLVNSQDNYYDAVQRLQDADAAVVRAREAAIKEKQSSPEYAATVKGVEQAFQAYSEKRNALVDDLSKKNPVYNQMKAQATAIDAQIETARQNPATTPEQFEELYKNRDTFIRQWRQMESDSMDRAGITPLKQQWLDASKKLADLQDKQRAEVEGEEKLKAAVANAEEAKTNVQQAREAIGGAQASGPGELTSNEQTRAQDFLCRYSGAGFAGNDAWWTYGWNTVVPAKGK